MAQQKRGPGKSSRDTECLFCRIANRGSDAFVVYESCSHIAFLTPYPTIWGETVVIPREHCGDHIFDLLAKDYNALLQATRDVGRLLIRGLKVRRCAMVFEGTGVAHVHAKLYPLTGELGVKTNVWAPMKVFFEEYPGWLTTATGPRRADDELRALAESICDAAR